MAVKYCIEHDVMADFLRKNRAEVKDVFLTEYDEKKVMNDFYEDGVEDGIAIEKKRGEERAEKERIELMHRMKDLGLDFVAIAQIVKLSEDEVRKILM